MTFEVLFVQDGYKFPVFDLTEWAPEAGLIEELKAKVADTSYQIDADGTAHIPINGPIMSQVPLLYAFFDIDAVGTWNLREKVMRARQDPQVKRIHFDVNSPGGSTLGLEEAASAIAESEKPTSAHSRDGAFSAGYYLGSQADTFTASKSTYVGNLGSVMIVNDFSKAMEARGIETHVLASGSIKGIGAFGAEITEEQKAFLQTLVDSRANEFKAAVKRGRGSKIDDVNALFTGEWWNAETAIKKGLLDSIHNGSIQMASKPTGDNGGAPEAGNGTPETPKDYGADIKSLTESVAALTGVVQSMVKAQKDAEASNLVSEAIKGGAIAPDSADDASALLNEFGADAFQRLLKLRTGVETNPNPTTSGGADLRDGNEKGRMSLEEEAQLRKWGVDPKMVAKYGTVREIDAVTRELVREGGKVEKTPLNPISDLSGDFALGGVPNAKLKELQLERTLKGMEV